MLLKLENPMILSRVVEIISELVTEVRLKVNESGMSISAMDPANVAMLGFKIPKSAFSQFEVGSEILGINLDNLKKILKRCGTKSTLIFETRDNLLDIYIYDRIKRNFSLSLIDVESEDIDFDSKIANMEFSVSVELNSMDLVDSIEDCAVVADACSFIIKEGKYLIQAKNLNSPRSEFSGDEANIKAFHTGEIENCKARYSLEYLSKFIKAAKLCERTVLEFADDHPLKMKFRTPEFELGFILAPRVETED